MGEHRLLVFIGKRILSPGAIIRVRIRVRLWLRLLYIYIYIIFKLSNYNFRLIFFVEFPVVCIEWITLPGSTVFEIFENNSREIGIPVAVARRHRPSRPIPAFPAFPRFLRRHSNICDGSEASETSRWL